MSLRVEKQFVIIFQLATRNSALSAADVASMQRLNERESNGK